MPPANKYKWSLLEDGLTQTQIKRYLECKRMFYFALMRGWSQEYMSDSIWFGILFHECLDVWYTAKEAALDPDTLAREVVAEMEDREQVDAWPLLQRQQWEFLVAQLYAVFPAYVLWYAKEDTKITWEVVEDKFKVPLQIRLGDGSKIEVPITGKIDGLCRTAPRTRAVFETKTKGRVNLGGIRNTVSHDFQVNLYAWAANQTRAGKDRFNTVIYNIVKRPALRQTQTETLPDHTKRLQKELSKKGSEYFVRIKSPIKAKSQLIFQDSLKRLVREIAEFVLWDKGESPDKFSPNCLGPYGQCQFLAVCYDGNSAGLKRRDVAFPELETREE